MIEYAIDPQRQLVTVTVPGHVAPHELLDLLERLANDTAVTGLDRLFVCLNGSLELISNQDIKQLAERGTELWGKGDFHTAIVAARDIEFGIARMIATRRQRPTGLLRIFRSITDAKAWLDEPEPAD